MRTCDETERVRLWVKGITSERGREGEREGERERGREGERAYRRQLTSRLEVRHGLSYGLHNVGISWMLNIRQCVRATTSSAKSATRKLARC